MGGPEKPLNLDAYKSYTLPDMDSADGKTRLTSRRVWVIAGQLLLRQVAVTGKGVYAKREDQWFHLGRHPQFVFAQK